MGFKTTSPFLVLALSLSGCVTPLTSHQQAKYSTLAAQGLIVEEKDPTVAATRGVLPGGGSFYTREVELGILNLFTWPLSILWDPISAHAAATKMNFYATIAEMQAERDKEFQTLERHLEDGEISEETYVKLKRQIEDTYAVASTPIYFRYR